MDRQGYPQSHTVPVTVHMTVQPTTAPRIANLEYLKTVPGILKIVQMVLDVLGMCTYLYASIGATLFHTVAHLGFWVTSILLICCVFYLVQRFNTVPWLKIELYTSAVWTALYILVTSLMAANLGTGDGGYIAATIFGIGGVVAYGYDAILKYRDFTQFAPAHHGSSGPVAVQAEPSYPTFGDQPVMPVQTGYSKY